MAPGRIVTPDQHLGWQARRAAPAAATAAYVPAWDTCATVPVEARSQLVSASNQEIGHFEMSRNSGHNGILIGFLPHSCPPLDDSGSG